MSKVKRLPEFIAIFLSLVLVLAEITKWIVLLSTLVLIYSVLSTYLIS